MARKNHGFGWSSHCQNSFDAIKASADASGTANFGRSLPSKMVVDASAAGLGTCQANPVKEDSKSNRLVHAISLKSKGSRYRLKGW